jgi:hypothetical protein
MVVRHRGVSPRRPRCSSRASRYPMVGAFVDGIRREHGFSRPELGAVLGRSVASIAAYEQGWRRRPRTFLLDLLDAMPVDRISFNDVATWYEYRPVTTLDQPTTTASTSTSPRCASSSATAARASPPRSPVRENVVRAYERCDDRHSPSSAPSQTRTQPHGQPHQGTGASFTSG